MDGFLLGFQDGEGLWRRYFRYGNGSPWSGSSAEPRNGTRCWESRSHWRRGARSIPVSRLSAPERSEAVRGGRVRRPPDQNRSSWHAGLYRSSATRRAAEVNTVAINARVTIPRVVSARALCHVRGQHGSE